MLMLLLVGSPCWRTSVFSLRSPYIWHGWFFLFFNSTSEDFVVFSSNIIIISIRQSGDWHEMEIDQNKTTMITVDQMNLCWNLNSAGWFTLILPKTLLLCFIRISCINFGVWFFIHFTTLIGVDRTNEICARNQIYYHLCCFSWWWDR